MIPDFSQLTKGDKELLFSGRWLAAEIAKLGRGQGCPPEIAEHAEDLIDVLTEVLDVDVPTHLDSDRMPNPQADRPTVDEQSLDGLKSAPFSERTIGKVFCAIGHNAGTGARSFDGLDEWATSKLCAEMMVKLAPAYGLEVMIGIRDRSLGYGAAMRKHGAASDNFEADVAMEIHRNAYDGSAKGAEFIHASEAGKTVARFFAAASKANYSGVILRASEGALDRSKGGNGRGFCRAPKAPAIVVEECFFDNRQDWPRVRDFVEKEARTYLAACKAAIMFGFGSGAPSLAKAEEALTRTFPQGSLQV